MSSGPTLTAKLSNIQHVSEKICTRDIISPSQYLLTFYAPLLPRSSVHSPSHLQMPALIAATVASDKPIDGYLIQDIVSIQSPTILIHKYMHDWLIFGRKQAVSLKLFS